MTGLMPRVRWWRALLDWLQWHGPAWLVPLVPNWGIDWIEIVVDAKSVILKGAA